jgi:hypothetical protein
VNWNNVGGIQICISLKNEAITKRKNMKNIITIFIGLFVFFINFGCTKDTIQSSPAPQLNLENLYQASISDAMIADSSEICDTLWQINHTNSNLEWKTINGEEYLLVGNFNKYPGTYSDTSLTNSWGLIWVFIPDQFSKRMKSTTYMANDTLLRMRQLLGLPPNNQNNYIVELWVKPEDLFRPAADSEIDDQKAGLYFPANADTNYVKWFNQNIYDSYFSNWTHYPWTRLGYSYDWSGYKSEVGISEFCIKTASLLYVKKLSLATKYIGN